VPRRRVLTGIQLRQSSPRSGRHRPGSEGDPHS
jgi:hypothetical protein